MTGGTTWHGGSEVRDPQRNLPRALIGARWPSSPFICSPRRYFRVLSPVEVGRARACGEMMRRILGAAGAAAFRLPP